MFDFDFESPCATDTVPIADAEEKGGAPIVCSVRALLRVDEGTNADDA